MKAVPQGTEAVPQGTENETVHLENQIGSFGSHHIQ